MTARDAIQSSLQRLSMQAADPKQRVFKPALHGNCRATHLIAVLLGQECCGLRGKEGLALHGDCIYA